MATVSDNKYAYYNQADSVFYPHQSKHGVVGEDTNHGGKMTLEKVLKQTKENK